MPAGTQRNRTQHVPAAPSCPQSKRPAGTVPCSPRTRPATASLAEEVDGHLRGFPPDTGGHRHEGTSRLPRERVKHLLNCDRSIQPLSPDSDRSLLEGVLLSDTQLWKAARSGWHRLFIAGLLMDPDAKRDFASVTTSAALMKRGSSVKPHFACRYSPGITDS